MPIGNKRAVSNDGPDFYPTPEWAVQALLSQETFTGSVLEPCCGDGAISKVLLQNNLEVESSDLHDYGYGESGVDATKLTGPVHNLITNPPYNIAEELLKIFLNSYTGKIALLLRLSFLESKKRYPLFQEFPPSRVYVFPERLSLSARGETVKGGGTISYGWFVWEKGYLNETVLRWLPIGFKK